MVKLFHHQGGGETLKSEHQAGYQQKTVPNHYKYQSGFPNNFFWIGCPGKGNSSVTLISSDFYCNFFNRFDIIIKSCII